MTNHHEVLRKHAQLQREARKRADDELTTAARAQKRAGETEADTIARLHAEAHPSILKYYGIAAEGDQR
ncbi:MAG: hypothetical protein GX539_09490 [Candidatus Cloacimonetes bacterium]|nr:hypothetical protein [Candidatus Cloacimonadota bacterium]